MLITLAAMIDAGMDRAPSERALVERCDLRDAISIAAPAEHRPAVRNAPRRSRSQSPAVAGRECRLPGSPPVEDSHACADLLLLDTINSIERRGFTGMHL